MSAYGAHCKDCWPTKSYEQFYKDFYSLTPYKCQIHTFSDTDFLRDADDKIQMDKIWIKTF